MRPCGSLLAHRACKVWAVTLGTRAVKSARATAWPGGACCVCAVSPDVAGLSHSGRGSQDLKSVSDGWDELLRRTGSRPPRDTRSVKRSLVRPSAVLVPESAPLGWPSTGEEGRLPATVLWGRHRPHSGRHWC